MTNEVTSIGVGMDTDGVERGIKTLKVLAEQGPKVEKAMSGIEGAAKSTGRTLESLAKGAPDLKGVADGAQKAGSALGGMGQQAREAVTGTESLRRAMGQLSAEEQKYIKGLYDEARQLSMTRGEKAAYIAQSKGMSASAQEVARAIGNKVDALKQEQVAQANAAKSANAMASANEGLASNLQMAVRGVQALVGLQVVAWAKDSAAALFEASAAAERLRIGLDFASARGSADEIAYLRKTTDGLGLAFQSTAQSYMQFQAAAKGTTLEGEKARAVFESVAKASAVMGLSAEQNSGVLLALQQMVSKGTVQAEELRGQLGERLPGAFQIAARAMGVTTAELGKMLEQGQVVSEDFLPKFAKELEASLGGAAEKAADRLDAAVNRFDNAWERLKQKAGDSGVSKAMAAEMNAIARDMTAIEETIARASAEGAGAISALGQGAAVAAGRMDFATLNLAANTLNGAINLLTGGIFDLQTNMALLPDALKTNAEQLAILSGKSADAEEQLKHLQSLGGQFGSEVWYKNEIARATAVASEYRKALADKQALMNGGASAIAYTDGMGNSKAILGQRKALEDQTKAALDATKSYQSLAERMAEVRKNGDKAREALKALESAGEGSSKQAEQLRDRIKGVDEQLAKMAKSGNSGASSLKKQENAYQTLADKAADYVQSLQIQAQQGSKLTQSQKLQIELDSLLAKGKGKVSAAAVAQIQASIAIAKAMEGEAVATKRAQDAYEDYLKLQDELAEDYVKQSKAREALWVSLDKSAQAISDESEMLSLQEGLIGRTSAARDIAIAKLQIERDLREEIASIDSNLDLDEPARIEARARARENSMKKIANAERKVYLSEWEKTSQLIGDTLADYIMGGGKDAAQYLKRLFATLVLQPVVQGVVGGVLGTGTAQAGQVGGSSTMSAISSGQSLWSAFSGNLTAGIGGTIASLGTSFGASAATAFGSGIAAGGSLGLTAGLSQGATLVSAGGTAAGIGTMIGAVAPWVAAASAVYSIIKGFDKSGTPHTGAGAIYKDGAVSGGNSIFNGANFNFGARWNDQVQGSVTAIAGGLGSALDSVATSFGNKAGYSIYTAFADDSSGDGAWGSLKIADAVGNVLVNWQDTRRSRWAPKEFADGEEGYKQYLTAIASDVKSAFMAMDLPAWADNILAAATDLDTLNAALSQIAVNKAGFDALGQSMSMFKGISEELQTQLLATAGSMQTLSSIASSYYGSSIFSEQERMLSARKQMMDALSAVNLYIDPAEGEKAKALFKATVAEAMRSGQGELAVKLMAMSQSFATAADYAAKAASDAARAAADARQGAWDSAMASLEAAVDREKSYWQGIESAAQTAVSTLTTTLDLLTSTARELYGTVDGTAQMLAAQGMVYIEDALSAVRGGKSVAGFDQLQEAISAARGGISSGAYATQFERDRDALVLAGQLSELGDLTDVQLSVQERQLKAAQSQIDQLDKTLQYWQDALSLGQLQIDATMTVTQAVEALGPLLAGLQNAKAAAAYAPAITSVTSRTPDEKAALYLEMLGAGLSDAQIREQVTKTTGAQTDTDWNWLKKLAGIPGYATGGLHPGGLRLVGERGPELEVTGPARYWDANKTMQMLQGGGSGGSTQRLEALVETLTAEVRRLQLLVNEGNGYAGQTADILDRVTERGNAMRSDIINTTVTVEVVA